MVDDLQYWTDKLDRLTATRAYLKRKGYAFNEEKINAEIKEVENKIDQIKESCLGS